MKGKKKKKNIMSEAWLRDLQIHEYVIFLAIVLIADLIYFFDINFLFSLLVFIANKFQILHEWGDFSSGFFLSEMLE